MLTLDLGCGVKRECDVNLDINSNVNPDIVSDLNYLPFKHQSFSLVNFNNSLEHVKNPSIPISEARRVLIKKGIISIKFPNHFSLVTFFRFIKRKPYLHISKTDIFYDKHWSYLSIPKLIILFIRDNFMPFKIVPELEYLTRALLRSRISPSQVRAMRIIYTLCPYFNPDATLFGYKR